MFRQRNRGPIVQKIKSGEYDENSQKIVEGTEEEEKDSEVITDSVRTQAFNSVQGHVTDVGGVRFKKTALIMRGIK